MPSWDCVRVRNSYRDAISADPCDTFYHFFHRWNHFNQLLCRVICTFSWPTDTGSTSLLFSRRCSRMCADTCVWRCTYLTSWNWSESRIQCCLIDRSSMAESPVLATPTRGVTLSQINVSQLLTSLRYAKQWWSRQRNLFRDSSKEKWWVRKRNGFSSMQVTGQSPCRTEILHHRRSLGLLEMLWLHNTV